jgi:intracellular sulfur oxidation DsrE/DsrF family protein
MAPKAANPQLSVFVVVNGNGVDSVYASDASATERAEELKSAATDPSAVKVELHKVKEDKEKPAAKPGPKAAAKKTKSPEEQHAANAEKPSK